MDSLKNEKFSEIDNKYKDDQPAADFFKANWIFSRGSYYAKQGQTREAINDFEEAIKIKNDFLPAYYSLSFAYMEIGEENKAAKIFSKCPDVMKSGSNKIIARREDFWKHVK
ncbi:MAG: tetratricopeptide repeat protein [Patescibacteria group bacterium]|jgi:tetratricopeptide (TPR) repeat protein